MAEIDEVGVEVQEEKSERSGSGSVGRLNPLVKRLKPNEAADVLCSMELLKGVGVEADDVMSDTMNALRELAQKQQVARQARVPEDFNKTLEDAVAAHYQLWIANVRNKASRAIDWVMQSMLEDATQGRVTLSYDIPPGQEDFLHDTFPEWMTEERGVDVLRTVVQEELLAKGFRTPKDALEKRTHGANSERYYFKLAYHIPSPSEFIPSAPVTPSPFARARSPDGTLT